MAYIIESEKNKNQKTENKNGFELQIRENSNIQKILTIMSLSDGVFPMSLIKYFGEDKASSLYSKATSSFQFLTTMK